MAQSGGGGGFGWFIVGVAMGVAGTLYGPGLYQQYVLKRMPAPQGSVRMEIPPGNTPGEWSRSARIDIEYSRYKANGRNWDWPMTDPELQLCIREGMEKRVCYGPKEPEVASCQAKFRCTTAVIAVPNGPFEIELNEQDDYNANDPIGVVSCDIGQTCKFQLGIVTVRDARAVTSAAP